MIKETYITPSGEIIRFDTEVFSQPEDSLNNSLEYINDSNQSVANAGKRLFLSARLNYIYIAQMHNIPTEAVDGYLTHVILRHSQTIDISENKHNSQILSSLYTQIDPELEHSTQIIHNSSDDERIIFLDFLLTHALIVNTQQLQRDSIGPNHPEKTDTATANLVMAYLDIIAKDPTTSVKWIDYLLFQKRNGATNLEPNIVSTISAIKDPLLKPYIRLLAADLNPEELIYVIRSDNYVENLRLKPEEIAKHRPPHPDYILKLHTNLAKSIDSPPTRLNFLLDTIKLFNRAIEARAGLIDTSHYTEEFTTLLGTTIAEIDPTPTNPQLRLDMLSIAESIGSLAQNKSKLDVPTIGTQIINHLKTIFSAENLALDSEPSLAIQTGLAILYLNPEHRSDLNDLLCQNNHQLLNQLLSNDEITGSFLEVAYNDIFNSNNEQFFTHLQKNELAEKVISHCTFISAEPDQEYKDFCSQKCEEFIATQITKVSTLLEKFEEEMEYAKKTQILDELLAILDKQKYDINLKQVAINSIGSLQFDNKTTNLIIRLITTRGISTNKISDYLDAMPAAQLDEASLEKVCDIHQEQQTTDFRIALYIRKDDIGEKQYYLDNLDPDNLKESQLLIILENKANKIDYKNFENALIQKYASSNALNSLAEAMENGLVDKAEALKSINQINHTNLSVDECTKAYSYLLEVLHDNLIQAGYLNSTAENGSVDMSKLTNNLQAKHPTLYSILKSYAQNRELLSNFNQATLAKDPNFPTRIVNLIKHINNQIQ